MNWWDVIVPALGVVASIGVALIGSYASKQANRIAARKATSEMFSELCEAQQEAITQQREWIVQLQAQIVTNNAEIRQLCEKVEARDQEIGSLSERLRNNDAEIGRLLGRIHDLETENQALRAEIAALKAGRAPSRKRAGQVEMG
jgi:chromosome segregation ATPase